jgi:hypothetical protein
MTAAHGARRRLAIWVRVGTAGGASGIEAIFTPAGKRTRTGLVKEFSVLPSPNSPWLPRPQAYKLPLASSTYWAAFEVPTSSTFPGNLTATGEVRVRKSPGGPGQRMSRQVRCWGARLEP